MHQPRRRSALLVPLTLVTVLAGILQAVPAVATSTDVTTNADSGPGSLRQAIIDANADPGSDTISFSIGGGGAKIISVSTPLPPLTEPTLVDGTTQELFAGTPLITIDGSTLSGSGSGLTITSNDGSSTVKGLQVVNFPDYGILVNQPTSGPTNPVTISGNYLGTDGSTSMSNDRAGIFVNGRTDTVIGGTNAGDGNVISGNDDGVATCCGQGFGIQLTSGANQTVIQGNLIGTNAAGTAALKNRFYGILVGSSGNTIGGTTAVARNVISGNGREGISLGGSTATNNTVRGNYIGVGVDGTTAIPNTSSGILFNGSGSGNVIGGSAAGARNIISGNTGGNGGIYVASSNGQTIQGNYIGTDVLGTTSLGNANGGIRIDASANISVRDNVIAFNLGYGVRVEATSTKADIQNNSIFSNTALGIDLVSPGDPANGVTPNDGGDIDSGANDLLNTPVISSVAQNGGNVDVSGSFDIPVGTTIAIDIYKNAACDPSTYGEGETFFGTGSIAEQSGGGSTPFTISIPGSLSGSRFTATATDQTGNTSEFSNCFDPGVPQADMKVEFASPPAQVTAGQHLTLSTVSTNLSSTTSAHNVVTTITVPSSVDQIVATPPSGTTCGPLSATQMTCTTALLAAGGTAQIAVDVRTSTTPGSLGLAAHVAADEPDGTSANNDASAAVTANDASPGFAPAKSYALAGTAPGAHSVVTGLFNNDAFRDVVVTNPGNGKASILLGSANGTLGAAASITLAGTPRWIAAGSVDAGATLDLVVNTEVCGTAPTDDATCGTLQFVPGDGNAAGTFGSSVAIDVSNAPRGIALHDVNGDHMPDLITADGLGADLSVSIGNPNGTFAAATTYGTSGGQYGIDVGDLNGDGNLDVVTTSQGTLTAFLGNGDGTFQAGTTTAIASTSTTPWPFLADVNADGVFDVVIGGNARVLIGNGDGTFGVVSDKLASASFFAATGDFNGDGEPDIEAAATTATPPSPDLRQLRGQGDGTFATGPTALLQYRITNSLATADLNGDGKSDVIAPNSVDNKITVLLSTTVPAISNVTISHGPANSVPAGFSSIGTGTLDFSGLDLLEGTVETSAGPLAAPIPSKPIPSKPIPSKPIPSKPIPSKAVGAASPLSAVPLSSLITHQIPNPPLLTQVGIDVTGGWPEVLKNTGFANVPLQNINFNQVSQLSPVASITLDHFDFSGTALGSLPPAAFLYGETRLSDIGLPAGVTWDGTNGLLTQMWGITAATQFCSDAISRTDLSQTLVDLALARCPIAIAPWSTMRLTDVTLTAAKAPLYSFLFTGIDVTKIHYTLGANDVTLGDLPLNQVPAGVVDCSAALACTSANTLADAQSQDTFQPHASFGNLFAGGAAVIGDMTLGDLLLGIVQKDGFPYENVSLQNLLAAAQPGLGGSVTYTVGFNVVCPTPSSTTISVRLPNTQFGYVAGSSTFAFGAGSAQAAPNPAEVNAGVLTWTLPATGTVCNASTSPVHVTLVFHAQPSPTTGSFIGSTRITTSGGDSTNVKDVPLTLTPANEPSDPNLDTISNAIPTSPNTLYTGGFTTPSDVDYFQVPVGPNDLGSLVTVYLSHMTSDDDLVLYGSAAEDLSSKPIPSKPIPSKSVGDQEGCLPTGYVLQPQTLDNVPQGSTSTLAIRGFSTNRSDQEEVVCTTVSLADIDAGHLTFQVSHNSGSVDGDTYVVRYLKEQDESNATCTGPSFPFAGQGTTYGPGSYSKTVLAGNTVPASTQTLFLINEQRFGDLYGPTALQDTLAKLQALAVDQQGAIIPVESNATGLGNVASAYAALNQPGNECSPETANAIVKSINKLDGTMTAGASPRYVVLVGSDSVIPFARLQDLTTLGNQVAYAPNLRFNNVGNPESRAFARGMFLSDDPYGTLSPAPWVGNLVYLPDMSVGRLVETPTEIQNQIQGFLDRGGVIDPKTAMVTGTDFSRDVANQILVDLSKRADDLNHNPLPNDYDTTSLISNSWSRAEAICRLDGSTLGSGCSNLTPSTFTAPGLISINGHFDHFRTLPGEANTNDLLSTTDFLATKAQDGTLLFTIGCNAGVSVPDGFLPANAPEAIDWAQALAKKNGSLVANNGYGYGDTTRIAYSERLMRLFATNLDGSFTIGDALREAKVSYWLELATYSPYDVKSLEQSTFYGLPMYEITGSGSLGGSSAPQIKNDPATGLDAANVTLPKGSDPFFVNPAAQGDGGDRRDVPGVGSYYVGPRAQTTTGYPIEPISDPISMTAPPSKHLRLHGAMVTGLEKRDFPNFDPVIGSTQLNGAAAGVEPRIAVGISPTDFLTTSFAGGRDSLVMYGGQYTANLATPGLGNQRVYTKMSARGFYAPSTDNDFTPPDVATNSGQVLPGNFATFSTTTNATDAKAAYVLYLPTGSNIFKLLQLSPQGTAPFHTFQGTVSAPTGVSQFATQIVDASGNVAIDTFKGASLAVQPVPTPPSYISAQIIKPSTTNLHGQWYDGPVTVRISTSSFSPITTRLDGNSPSFNYFSVNVAVPGTDGVHRVDYTVGAFSSTVFVPIDKGPPVVAHIIGDVKYDAGDDQPYISAGATITINVADPSGIASCSIRVTGPNAYNQVTPCAEGDTDVTLPNVDGRYTIRTTTTDNAGNSAVDTDQFDATRDSTPPRITPGITGHQYPTFSGANDPIYVRSDTTLSMNVEDLPGPGANSSASGVRDCTTTLTNVLSPECSAGLNQYFAAGADGAKTLTTTAADNVSNQSTKSLQVILDNTPPSIARSINGTPGAGDDSVYTSGGTTWVRSNAALDVSVTDTGSGLHDCQVTSSPGSVQNAPPAAPGAGCSSGNTHYNALGSDGPRTISIDAADNVANASSSTIGVNLDNTAPIFGSCPTPNPGVSGKLATAITTTSQTGFTVNEIATPPHTQFIITVDPGTTKAETMLVTKRAFVGSSISQASYTVTRGYANTAKFTHTLNAPVVWNLLARQDLLGSPTVTLGNSATTTTLKLTGQRFGLPAAPFLVVVDQEQLLVTNVVTTGTGTYDLTVVRQYNGTSLASHTSASRVMWSGQAYGKIPAASGFSATAQTFTVKEGRFGAPAVPFEINVGTERMTVVQRVAAGANFTYTVARGVDGTKAIAHNPDDAVWTTPTTAVYLHSPSQVLAVPVTDNVVSGVTGSGVYASSFSLTSGSPAVTAGTYAPGTGTYSFTLNPNGASVGVATFPVRISVKDNVGNASTPLASVTSTTTNPSELLCWYEITYAFSGFGSPVNNDSLNSENGGSATPLKWKITDYAGVGVTDPNAIVSVTASVSKTCDTTPEFTVQDQQVKGGSNLMNQGGGVWQFNWGVPTSYARSCRTVGIRLASSGLNNPLPVGTTTPAPSRRYEFTNVTIK